MAKKSDAQKEQKKALGRLTTFGLTAPWQAPLLLPSGWDDMSSPLEDFLSPVDCETPLLVVGVQSESPSVNFKKGTPRLSGTLVDRSGNRLRFSKFGDTRKFEEILKKAGKQPIYLFGRPAMFNNQLWLNDPELIHPWWVGRFRPRYPGKPNVIGPELVRQRVLSLHREHAQTATDWIIKELADICDSSELTSIAGCPDWTVKEIIDRAHLPGTPAEGKKAHEAMESFAALGIMKQARHTKGKHVEPTPVGDWRKRAAGIPFPLTIEQSTNVEGICSEISSPTSLHGLLSGDVGFGKTAVYGTVAAAVADGGGRVAILLPSETLAEQIYAKDLKVWFPDLKIVFMAGDVTTGDPKTAQIVIGTTAIIHRLDATEKFDLIVVDEQQRFSRDQREALLKEDTNLLEVSATPIPRTGALIRYGVVKVWHLTRAFKDKNIVSRIWYPFEKAALFNKIRWSLDPQQGHQVLVIYPLREESESDKDNENPSVSQKDNGPQQPKLPSVMEAFEQWNKIFPGQVRALHGALKSDEKQAVMDDMLADRAQILLATTVVEVGVNLPKLRRVVVMHPDRFGLSQLHQIRGRAARQGGDGFFDMLLPHDKIKDETMARLKVLEESCDGYKIAEADMRLRGIGSLAKNSDKQTGADETFLFGRGVSLDVLDRVMEYVGNDPRQEKDIKTNRPPTTVSVAENINQQEGDLMKIGIVPFTHKKKPSVHQQQTNVNTGHEDSFKTQPLSQSTVQSSTYKPSSRVKPQIRF